MTVLLGAGSIFVIVMTIIFARDLAKAVFGDATDGFTEFSRAFFCFYMMLVVTMELLGFGMAIASLWQ